MKSTPFEFRFRLLIAYLLYAIGFWAPWIRNGERTTAWLELTGLMAAHRLLSLEAASLLITGLAIACVVLGALLRVWGTAYLGNVTVWASAMHAQEVTAAGPYRHTRNPLYLGSFLIAVAVSILMPWSGSIFFVLATVILYLRLIHGEEIFLAAQQGDAYRAYKARVPRLLPSIAPKTPAASQRPAWLQSLLGETFPVALAICFAVLAWSYNAQLLTRAVIICFGASLVVKAFLPKAKN
jgi:protein-S-isoprenylcysteine O-methyltransferase Ste14